MDDLNLELELEVLSKSPQDMPWESLEELRSHLARIEEAGKAIRQRVENYTEEVIAPIQEKIDASVSQQKEKYSEVEELQKEIQKLMEQVAEFRRAQSAAEMEKRKAEYGLTDLKNQLAMLRKRHGEVLEIIAAQARMEELAKKVYELFDQELWKNVLKDHQKEDILAILKAFEDGTSGILNANIMGAGKTAETALALKAMRQLFYTRFDRLPRVLWVTKKSLKGSSFKEWRKWDPEVMPVILDGQDKAKLKVMFDVALQANMPIIINYEMMNAKEIGELILETAWDVVIMDEVHKLKGGANPTPTKVFENARSLLGIEEVYKGFYSSTWERNKEVFFMPLSGSPAQNKVQELWCYLHLFAPDRFPSVKMFEREYCTQYYDEQKQQHLYRANTERILKVLRGQVIRQDPKKIQAAWPSRRYAGVHVMSEINPEAEGADYYKGTEIPHTDAQAELYAFARANFMIKLEKLVEDEPDKALSATSMIALLIRLRQINLWPPSISITDDDGNVYSPVAESAKLDYVVDRVETLLEEEEPVVIWSSQFVPPLYELRDRINKLNGGLDPRVAMMIGDTSSESRQIEEGFQQGKYNVLLCNRMSVSEGFNFQKSERWPGGSRYAIFLDRWWNPEGNKQAEQRIWREGATEGVIIEYLHSPGTVDNFILQLNAEKDAMFRGVFGGERSTLKPQEWLDILDDLI